MIVMPTGSTAEGHEKIRDKKRMSDTALLGLMDPLMIVSWKLKSEDKPSRITVAGLLNQGLRLCTAES